MATGETNAPCEDSSAINLEDKYAYFDNNFEFEDGEKNETSVKGGLRRNVKYWENTLRAKKEILKITKEGYKLPFAFTPLSAEFLKTIEALQITSIS